MVVCFSYYDAVSRECEHTRLVERNTDQLTRSQLAVLFYGKQRKYLLLKSDERCGICGLRSISANTLLVAGAKNATKTLAALPIVPFRWRKAHQ